MSHTTATERSTPGRPASGDSRLGMYRRQAEVVDPQPLSPPLEDETVPTPAAVSAVAREVCGQREEGARWDCTATV